MNIHQFQKLINRYLRNKSGDIEKNAINLWFSPDTKASANPKLVSDDIRKSIFNKILRRIESEPEHHTINKRKLFYGIGIAAALLLASGISVILIQANFSKKKHETQLISFHTPRGQKGKISLPDGSVIWINSSSAIRYPKKFNDRVREIYLDKGEAFFQVKHSNSKAFIVHSSELNTQVLGTSFNIRSDTASHQIFVTVSTGKVSVFASDSSRVETPIVTLLPNEEAAFNQLNGIIRTTKADASTKMVWKDQVLLFRNAGLKEVKDRLEDWYNIHIIYKNPIDESCLITGRFENKSIYEVLKSMREINGFDFKIKNDDITINNTNRQLNNKPFQYMIKRKN